MFLSILTLDIIGLHLCICNSTELHHRFTLVYLQFNWTLLVDIWWGSLEVQERHSWQSCSWECKEENWSLVPRRSCRMEELTRVNVIIFIMFFEILQHCRGVHLFFNWLRVWCYYSFKISSVCYVIFQNICSTPSWTAENGHNIILF